jgi:hypothetical protein
VDLVLLLCPCRQDRVGPQREVAFLKMMTTTDNSVLITGGAGFVGCALAERLVRRGVPRDVDALGTRPPRCTRKTNGYGARAAPGDGKVCTTHHGLP